MEQLRLAVDSETAAADTSNRLYEDPWRQPVRQSVPKGLRSPARYPDLQGFGSAGIATTGRPVRWQRSRPFNLMPPPTPRLVVGQPSSLRLLGQVIMIVGLVSSALAAWYLWGTGLLTAGEQSRLAEEFQARLLATSDVTALPLGEDAADAASEITASVAWDDPVIHIDRAELEPVFPALPSLIAEEAPQPGDALGRIVIPKADVDWIAVEGITPEDLRSGPGHVRGSAMPGQVGNTVISGHRTTNGAPFYHLDRLERGDTITIETLIGVHTYAVVDTRVVEPSDTWVATQWEGSWLTLATCTPRFSSSNRLIVFAQLIDGPNAEAIHARFGLAQTIPTSTG